MLQIIRGNIFNSKAEVLVNTVNTVGVMGAGIALEMRLRYPEMYEKYKFFCKNRDLDIGKLWLYKGEDRYILNFPTKKHWKFPSKIEYIEAGLRKFVATYKKLNITSIAFPVLGAGRGGIDEDLSIDIMSRYLSDLDIDVEIYQYDPYAKDDLFEKFRNYFLHKNEDEIKNELSIAKNIISKIKDILNNEEVYQINQLAKFKGIGDKTLEKIFAKKEVFDTPIQKTLF